jgi:hypothetical protein
MVTSAEPRQVAATLEYYYLLLLLFNWTANGFLPGGKGATIRHDIHKYNTIQTHKISYHAQTKQSTQSYTNNKGNITYTEYNTQKK